MMPDVQVMTKFKLNEISAVTRPAQGGALAVIMKRADDAVVTKQLTEEERERRRRRRRENDLKKQEDGEDDEERKRRNRRRDYAKAGDLVDLLTSAEEGHQHGVVVNVYEDNTYVIVNYASEQDSDTSHDHQLVMDSDGTITVSENEGHSHTLDGEALRQILFDRVVNKVDQNTKTISLNNAAELGGLIVKETTMPNPTVSKEDHDKVVAQLAKVSALATMSEIHKGYYTSLDGTKQEEFITKSVADRDLDVQLAKSDDPVVYTSDAGENFLKSDDQRFVRMAKKADLDSRELKKAHAKNAELEFSKRADKELSKLPGDSIAKSALLRAVDGIEDESIRKSVGQILAAANSGILKAFESVGSSSHDDTNDFNKSAQDKLEAKITKYASDNGVNETEAYTKVMGTKEGVELYNQANQR